jgi:glutathione synthase
MEQSDLFLENGAAKGLVRDLEVFENPDCWYQLEAQKRKISLADLDVILMRKDPPFDMEFVYSTYLLEIAASEGALVVNNPRSLRDCNEKLFATRFSQCCPELIVSRQMNQLREFQRLHSDVIFKPLDGMGGASIFRVKPGDPNISVILEQLTNHGSRQIMGQVYIPEIAEGDKRIIMVDGEPIPYCLARIPLAGESRGNLAAGGSGEVRPLSARDRWIANEVGPTLKAMGLMFVGLDVIGDYLTEINVTSPTCVREIDREANSNIGAALMQAIIRQLNSGT